MNLWTLRYENADGSVTVNFVGSGDTAEQARETWEKTSEFATLSNAGLVFEGAKPLGAHGEPEEGSELWQKAQDGQA